MTDEIKVERKTFTLEIKADDDKGVVTAVFAQTDVVDRGGDIIRPGSFGEQEVIVSAYNHSSSMSFSGELPVGKGKIFEKGDEAIAELQFFLNTEAGREHFEVIKALGGLQEYSFGFHVTETGELTEDLMKIGADRVIEKVRVFEVSPVLVGEGLNTRTLSVKSKEPDAKEAAQEELSKEAAAEFERFGKI